MHQEDYACLRVEVHDRIARVTIDNGHDGNIYGRDALGDFRRLPADVATDANVDVLLLRAEGAAFTLGLEPDAYPTNTQGSGAERFDSARAGVRSWVDLDKPVVVALNGAVQGAPLTTVLLADVVVAEDHVRFRDFHVPAGLVAATGALLWPPMVGLLQAKRYVLEGAWIDAAEAERLGLVSEVVARGASTERALEHAKRLASLPAHAVRHSKRALNEWLRQALTTVFEPALAMELLGWQSAADADRRRRGLTAEALEVMRSSEG